MALEFGKSIEDVVGSERKKGKDETTDDED